MDTILIFTASFFITFASEIGIPAEHRVKMFTKNWWVRLILTTIGMIVLLVAAKI